MAKKNLTAGLESVNTVADNNVVANNVTTNGMIDYSNIEWLASTTPIFPADATSSKCKIDREPKVQDGLKQLGELMPELSKTFLLLGAWWENKHARRELKNMLDAEATELGHGAVHYLQNVLRPEVEKLENIQEAINRLLYLTTYFKPREGSKASLKRVSIDGILYEIAESKLNELRNMFDDRDELREQVIANAKVVNQNVVEEL